MNENMTTTMDFSFGILTYNCAKYIVELLETIKYQVQNYGSGKRIQLIIGDDCSNDNSVSILKKWIEENGKLFQDIVIIENEVNIGTVANYNNVIHRVRAQYFHIIAGDDLYNCNNLFKYIEKTNEFDIITTFPLCLRENGDFFIDHNRLLRRVNDMKRNSYSSKRLLEKEVYGSLFHTPSTYFKRDMYSTEIEEFVSQFTLFEDDPKWIKFLQNTDSVCFDTVPIIIYRYHDQSVSHSNASKGVFKSDLIKLYEYYLSLDISFPYKIFSILKLRDIKKDNTRGLSYLIRFIEISFLKLKYSNNRMFRNIISQIENQKTVSKEYYMQIKNESMKYNFEEKILCK